MFSACEPAITAPSPIAPAAAAPIAPLLATFTARPARPPIAIGASDSPTALRIIDGLLKATLVLSITPSAAENCCCCDLELMVFLSAQYLLPEPGS